MRENNEPQNCNKPGDFTEHHLVCASVCKEIGGHWISSWLLTWTDKTWGIWKEWLTISNWDFDTSLTNSSLSAWNCAKWRPFEGNNQLGKRDSKGKKSVTAEPGIAACTIRPMKLRIWYEALSLFASPYPTEQNRLYRELRHILMLALRIKQMWDALLDMFRPRFWIL